MMKNIILASLISAIIGFVLGVICGRQMIAVDHSGPTVHSDTVIYVDTVKVTSPIPVDSVVLRHKTITDTIHVVINDKDTTVVANFEIPITQKEYRDSTYQAWVSGYCQSLDSIRIFAPTRQITTTIQKIQYKNKRFGIGVSCGVAYTGREISPYVGIGVQYNIFQW